MGALDASNRMIAALGMAGDIAPPPDPGSFVNQRELNDYIAYVDALVRDMNAYLVNNEDTLTPGAKNLWPSWVKFRIAWEDTSRSLRDDNWYVSRDDWDTVQTEHRKALEFKRKFEASGITFSGVKAERVPDTPAPGMPAPQAQGPTGGQVKVVNTGEPIRGVEPPSRPKGDDSGPIPLPSMRTILILGGAAGAFVLLKTWLENR